MIESIFYLSSTPRKCHCDKRKGSRQTVSSELTPREFHPNCRSDRAAQCCKAFKTGVPLFSLCIMAESGAARYFQSVFTAFCLSAGHGVPLHTLMLSQSQRGSVWRMSIQFSKSRPVFVKKEKWGKGFFALHPIVLEKPYFSPLLKKIF